MPSYTRASPDAKPVRVHGTVMGLPPAKPTASPPPISIKPIEAAKLLPVAAPEPMRAESVEPPKEGA